MTGSARPRRDRNRARAGLVAGSAAGLLAIAGCGSAPAPTAEVAGPPAGITGPALATSLSGGNGTAWAVLQMGGSAAQENNFWELFVRPPGGSWRLATPVGVASNGGLVAAPSGQDSLVTGFRPSQDLTFSPLAATADAGQSWTQDNVLGAGLANLPDAMAAGPDDRLLALTEGGGVQEGAGLGASWTKLTSLRALAGTPAVRATCSLTALTAAAWTPGGDPLLGGSCGAPDRPHRAGIFALMPGAWQAVGPVLPATLPRGPVTVLGLASSGPRTTAVLAAGSGAATVVVAAWSVNGGTSWSVSPALRTGAGPRPSVSVFADGSAGLVLTGGRAVTIGWQAADWRILPAVPARTAALAQTAAGQPEALAAAGDTMTAWQLSSAAAWVKLQTVHVTIPYGSSS